VKRFHSCLTMGLGCLLMFSAIGLARADDATDDVKSSRKEPLRVSGSITNEPKISELKLVPPFVRQRQGDVTTTAVWPLYFQRKAPGDLQRLVVPYFYRRGAKLNADVALGLVWSLRGPDRNTFVLPPLYTHRNGKDWGFGLLPLFSTGIFSGHHHTVIPPLLTWIDGDDKHFRLVMGPYFDWQGPRKKWKGLFPIYWSKEDDVDRFTLVPPFFFRFADDDPLDYKTVVPPFYHKRMKDQSAWGVVPLVFAKNTKELNSITVPLALFHYANGPQDFRLVTPVISYANTRANGRTLITPLYQRRRGDRNFDSFAPLFFHGWDNRDASSSLILPPIYWNWKDPANDTTVVLPFFGRWFHEGISSTWLVPVVGRYKSFEKDEQAWWVAPSFHLGWTEDSWQFNVHPLFYLKKAPEKSHLAIAPLYFDFRNKEEQTRRLVAFPLYWDFANWAKQKHAKVVFPLYWSFDNYRRKKERKIGFPLYYDFSDGVRKKRTTVAFPLYFRTERGERTRHFSLNSFYETKRDPKGSSWQYHFFPLFSFGGGEQEKWWKFLYGFAGYEKRGSHRRINALWIPINLD
jgi:hypothetical protein